MVLFAYPASVIQAGFARILATAARCHVESAYTGRQAIARLRWHHTVLVCAWKLPDMSALELIEHVHGLGWHLPVLVIARNSSVQDAAAALHAGCHGYVWEGAEAEALPSALLHVMRGVGYVICEVERAAPWPKLWTRKA